MKMNKTFGLFYGELTAVAKQASEGNVAFGVLFEPASPEMIDWGSCSPAGVSMAINLADNTPSDYLTKKVLLKARDRALDAHRKSMTLVHQGVLELCDADYSATMNEEKIAVSYYDICERIGATMGVSLGKSLGRITIATHAETVSDTYAVQRAVCVYIRHFLSKNNLGTPNNDEWPQST